MFVVIRDIKVVNLFWWFLLGVVTFGFNFILVTLYYKLINQLAFFERFKNLLVNRRSKK